jgi:2-polyprenyl-6-methoxyphenol hydroxylase-like FAD-dependent oxidoreductase
MHELGLLTEFLKLPHSTAPTLKGRYGNLELTIADFRHLPTQCKYIALMPQWDFLNFLADHGRRYSGFHLLMQAEVTGLIEENGRIAGVNARTPNGDLVIRAPLVVGCDGRHSTVREKARLEVEDLGAPMDVLWFRLSRSSSDRTKAWARSCPGALS